MKRKGMGIVVALLFLLVSPANAAPTPTPTPKPGPRPVGAAAYIAVSLSEDGAVLLGQAVHAHMAPASLTKIVTALVSRDQYGLDDIVTVSPVVEQIEGSDAGLKPGQRIPVRDLLYALMLPSANDAAMALAAHHPAGYEHFIQLMNQKARSLGAYDSQFRNPHGLDMEGHYSSPWDMAILGRALLADPVLASIVSTRHHSISWPKGPPLPLFNHNQLLMRDKRVFGVKTGYTDNAGHSLVCAAHTTFGDILTVVMKSPNMYTDTQSLWEHAKARTLGAESGGGTIAGTTLLPLPPKAPAQALPALAKKPASDPRDDVRWAGLMVALALLTVLTLFRRRTDPLREAASVHGWLDPLVTRERA
jgi:serine-type D-Ala-D-Ala carboxypeptidase (penicillin-binding protein 5/6)